MSIKVKVVHIESGLGNQMLSFCEYLALKSVNPQDDMYIENVIFSIPECNDVICQWNGYELDRIFGIDVPNIMDILSINQQQKFVNDIVESQFWEKHWNYAPYITKSLCELGFAVRNIRGDFELEYKSKDLKHGVIGKFRSAFFDHSHIGNYIRRKLTASKLFPNNIAMQKKLFYDGVDNVFTGQRLSFKFRGMGIERIQEDIFKTFVFPEYTTEQNVNMSKLLDSTNSVFIHARRGDMLSANGWCYKYGFFKRAVKYIKNNVENPLFVFFTNTGSIEWCKKHAEDIFGLKKMDKVMFVDWNAGNQSFRDMQLMTHCKHGIITNSTFGWWGAYLIKNPNKITISPLVEINTTYHC